MANLSVHPSVHPAVTLNKIDRNREKTDRVRVDIFNMIIVISVVNVVVVVAPGDLVT